MLRKDKEWNTLSKDKRERGEFPRGGGALLLFVPPFTRSSWRDVVALMQLAEEIGFIFYGSFTWDHEIMGMGYDAGRNRKNELLLFTAGKRNGVLWDLGLPNVLRHKRLARRKGEHEAEKPVGLFWDLARALTRPGDVVADLFVGRGRWIQKLLHEGRHVVAVDREPRGVKAISGGLSQTAL